MGVHGRSAITSRGPQRSFGMSRYVRRLFQRRNIDRAKSQITEIDASAKPLSIVLWSDKSKLSSFGTQKGHPIVMRIGNLPSKIRNGTGLGGGRVVGFIPIVRITDSSIFPSTQNSLSWMRTLQSAGRKDM